jgi:hypothetical protein
VLENIAYLGLGFATVFLALEAAWHFTACKIHDKSIPTNSKTSDNTKLDAINVNIQRNTRV